jgi:phosphoribosylformylglycinamidine synthase subunit PurSL
MIHTIRVGTKERTDPHGRDVLAEARRTVGAEGVESIRTVKVYRLEGVAEADATRLAATLLAEPVDQVFSVNAPLIGDADHVVEVAYLPGVMNPEAASILRAARDLGIDPAAVDSSREYAFYGSVDRSELDRIVGRLLVNPTIERVVDRQPETLRVSGTTGAGRRIDLASCDAAALMALSDDGLHLDLTEMKAIQDHFRMLGRGATDLELEALAQTWSEHCKHKTFRAELEINGERKPSLMSRLKAAAHQYDALVVSAFEDNSGVMRFYDGWAVAGKVETHNSPSAIEPYGGAMTGSGGVFRDILGTGKGAKVVASTDMFCLAPPDLPENQVPPGALPPDYLLRRVVAGVRDYGNRMGIPTNNGSVHFHADFRAKPTVIVGAYGLLREEHARKGRPQGGDRILALGGRTGRDGIHGATFSSTAMTAKTSEVNAPAVQIGNAVEEKRLLDAVMACRDAGLIRAITDCGAGGFSSAIGEMAEGIGAEVDLDRAPLKYPGLAPWEIFLSESQERMVMAVAPNDVDSVMEICQLFNVEVSDLGSFEPTGRLRVHHGGEVVGDLEMEFLHDGLPRRVLKGQWAESVGWAELPSTPGSPSDWRRSALEVMGHPNVASKEPIVRQYDHTVQGTNVIPPYAGPHAKSAADAAVIAPLLGERYGLVIAHGLNPVLNTFDPYWGGLWAIAEALANLTAVGGDFRQASLIDNFIWPLPTPEMLGGLDRALEACVDAMHVFQIPFISGKDSLSSTYRYPDGRVLEIPPVLCVSVFGRIDDVLATVTPDFERAGNTLVLVGKSDYEGMGGATYVEVAAMRGERPARVDLEGLPAVFDAVGGGIRTGVIRACHDVSHGGLLAALAEMAIGSGMGAAVDLGAVGARPDLALYNETAGVFVVEVESAAVAADLFGAVPYTLMGTVVDSPQLVFALDGAPLFEVAVAELEEAWRAPMESVFH